MILLNAGAVLSSFVAAVFWFISAAGKTPIADKTFRGFLDTPEAIIAALKFSAKWNRLASIFSAFTALFLIAVIMNPRHAAARALVGWYLMTPPPMSEPERAGLSEPLGGWNIESSYDTATECTAAREALIQKGFTNFKPDAPVDSGASLMFALFRAAQCIATDDPRLKKNEVNLRHAARSHSWASFIRFLALPLIA
jgi:hypothetical protein